MWENYYTDYQYYRSDDVLTTKEEIQKRLGISSEQSEPQQDTTTPTQTTTTEKTNTQQSAIWSPRSGNDSGGAVVVHINLHFEITM